MSSLVEIGAMVLEKMLNFFIISDILSKYLPFEKFKPPHDRMLCAKFGLNRPVVLEK